jgi:hypothetical protein
MGQDLWDCNRAMQYLFIYIFIEHLEHYEHYLKNNDLQTPLNRTFTEQ